MMKVLYRAVKILSEKTKHLLETHLLPSGSLLMKIIISRFITPISYKNDRRHGLNFIMVMGMPVVVDDNYFNNTGRRRWKEHNTTKKL